jgi:hypothetical protein
MEPCFAGRVFEASLAAFENACQEECLLHEGIMWFGKQSITTRKWLRVHPKSINVSAGSA